MKQTLRTWYDRMDNFMMSLGFTKSKEDSKLYFKVEDGRPMILVLYVDDLFLKGEEELIIDAKRSISTEFEMKDLGMMHYFLCMEVCQSVNGIFLGQGKYEVNILKRFRMLGCKEIAMPIPSNLKLLSDSSSKTVDVTMYCHMIGSLMYMMNTRIDI